MKYRQCTLRNGTTELVAFLEASQIKQGLYVTLKDHPQPDLLWRIEELGQEMDEKDFKDSHGSKHVFGSIQREFE